jgi:CheY-like chemotaxis protein
MKLEGKRIFYVEDDVKNRSLVQIILEQAGATIGFERWGKDQTLPRLRAFAPVDLILLDLMLPRGVTGYDVFDAIRAEPEFAHVPIVAISASDPSIEIPRTRARGFAGFISKPIDLQSFPTQISTLINGQQIWETY